jgi:hypothetical protein
MSMFSLKKLALVAFVGAGMTLSGCLTNEEEKEEEKPPVVTPTDSVSSKTVQLGAQKNAKAGSVDLDTWTAYTSGDGKTKYADIDIVFAFSTSTTAGGAAIYSPNIAKNGVSGSSGGFSFMSEWPNANTTPLKIPASGFDFSKVKLASEIKAGYDAGTDPSVVGKVPVSVGTVVLVKTDKSAYVAVKVTAVVAAEDGTVDLTGIAKW